MQINKMTIKITLAVFLSILLGKLLNIESPFYAGIAAVITLQSGFEDTMKAINNRIAGTIIGISVGMICAYLGKGNMFFCFAGILVTTALCQSFKLEKSISVACIIFLAMNVNFMGKMDPTFYSVHRFIDTTVGLGVVIAVQFGDYLLQNFVAKRLNTEVQEIKEVKKFKHKTHHIFQTPFQFKKSA